MADERTYRVSEWGGLGKAANCVAYSPGCRAVALGVGVPHRTFVLGPFPM